MPENGYNKLASADTVNAEIKRIATELLMAHPESPLFVSLLRGANPFTAKLMFELVRQQRSYHPEVDYLMISTYGSGREAGKPKIITDLAPNTDVSGRTIVVIDDVLDKGVTADFAFAHLKERGAVQTELAVLCDKQTDRVKDIEATYKGFTFDDNWLTGMGMDNAGESKEAYCWLDEIWEVQK